jgi:hypothetical protein
MPKDDKTEKKEPAQAPDHLAWSPGLRQRYYELLEEAALSRFASVTIVFADGIACSLRIERIIK